LLTLVCARLSNSFALLYKKRYSKRKKNEKEKIKQLKNYSRRKQFLQV